jgi:hypothetical protein
MKSIAILSDPEIHPLPSFHSEDVQRALAKFHISSFFIDLKSLQNFDRSISDILVLPYLDGDLSGSPLEKIVAFHQSGGGLVFLGDTPHVGRSFPFRNSQAPELRLTRCRDPLKIRGLTPLGQKLLGDVPDWESMLHKPMVGVRTSAFPPDECHDLLVCEAGFKQLSPLVMIERKHPAFLGARVVMAGFDGGEPRENIMGVCQRPWTFDPGLLDRNWAGADTLVTRLILAAEPPDVALGWELDPVVQAGVPAHSKIRVRNLQSTPCEIELPTTNDGSSSASTLHTLEPGENTILKSFEYVAEEGPVLFHASARQGSLLHTTDRTQFGFVCPTGSPDLNLGFSMFRVFRDSKVDEAYKDFFRSTASMGMQYARLALAWEDLEPSPGSYDWSIPDQLLQLCFEEGIAAFFWVFPTARGSGLGEGGVPEWVLREPSIDRFGKPGNFPCIWSPFYRKHYFGFLEALALRYANDDRLSRLVFDFGNSDFPYTYHYYGDRGDLFDYSPFEQQAFAGWLERRGFPLVDLERRWNRPFSAYGEVTVPLSEQTQAWLLYNEFRTWGLHQGIKEAVAVIQRCAPSKAPPDFPGHGIGSIADLITFTHNSQASHWNEVLLHPSELTEAHNMGPQWGGEPWQVGGRFPDYDDALFQSVRLQANYLTIPGPDLGIWENDISRIAMIRRSLAGAKRSKPAFAVIDKLSWNDWNSLAHIASRLDQPVDLLSKTCRYDYSCYKLLVLPPEEVIETSLGKSSLLPLDEDFYQSILQSIENGLKVVIYPSTGLGDSLNPMRRLWGLEDVTYGNRVPSQTRFPDSWGGGFAEGFCSSVHGCNQDSILLETNTTQPAAIFRPYGKGGFVLLGFDSKEDSLDRAIRYNASTHLRDHTLTRILSHFGVSPTRLSTHQATCYKEFLSKGDEEFLIFYSHLPEVLSLSCEFHSSRTPDHLMELSSGITVPIQAGKKPGWFEAQFSLPPQKGFYFMIKS